MRNVFKGKDGQYYFHIKNASGEVLAQSEAYTRRTDAERGLRDLAERILTLVNDGELPLRNEAFVSTKKSGVKRDAPTFDPGCA